MVTKFVSGAYYRSHPLLVLASVLTVCFLTKVGPPSSVALGLNLLQVTGSRLARFEYVNRV